jgi:BolA protein
MSKNSSFSNKKSAAIEQEMKKRLHSKIILEHFEVKDFTGRHLNHEQHNGGFHLEAIIVSDTFMNMSLINRHKVVYKAMDELMNHEIHALSMKTLTVTEWKDK